MRELRIRSEEGVKGVLLVSLVFILFVVVHAFLDLVNDNARAL